ncbi:hypothetical protein H2200_004786 [Cladophialophora chaetospira]|uniref:Heterokaryon incompatibility domain-containing protein n=1 Tax=Cladophialophora chaetospira TaxID=386627 RepID=A0AA38XEJ6_9EURO|nr:hypothetical protein H2200_004786 [Cladophialophora chaetospira]
MEAISDAFRINALQWPDFSGYKPLNHTRQEIRLLRLNNDKATDLLQCTFEHCDLAEYPDYYALSYYWGAPPRGKDELKPLLVDGQMVYLRQTTHAFLQQLHNRFTDLVVWLDVLCIDQKNVEERNWQVAMMGDIFNLAVGVYSWLGEGNSDTNLIFDHINGNTTTEQRMVMSMNLLLRCLHQVFGVPYWNRMWILQEIVLARRVWLVSGNRVCDWDTLMGAVSELYKQPASYYTEPWAISATSGQSLWDNVHAIAQYRIQYCQHKEPEELHVLLRTFGSKECTEPRDRIFALRSLAQDGNMIKVDYTSSKLDLLFSCLAHSTRSRSLFLRSSTLEDICPWTQHDDPLLIKDLLESLQVSYSDLYESRTLSRSGIILTADRFPANRAATQPSLRNSLRMEFNTGHPMSSVKHLEQTEPGSYASEDSSDHGDYSEDIHNIHIGLHEFWADGRTVDPGYRDRWPAEGVTLWNMLFRPRHEMMLDVDDDAIDYSKFSLTRGFQICARARRMCREHFPVEGGETLDLPDRVKWFPVHVSRAMLLFLSIAQCYGRDMVPQTVIEHLLEITDGEILEELCDCETTDDFRITDYFKTETTVIK